MKACKGQRRCFPVNNAKFLKTCILKNICERLLLKISTSVTNLPKEVIPEFYYPFKHFGILNFAMAEWLFCQSFFSLKHDFFITHTKRDVIISPSLRLLLKVWICWRCQNRIEKYYYHDQGRSKTPSNQAFEGVKFMTIVNASDIFGKFFDVKFFVLQNVIPQNATAGDLSNTRVLFLVNKIYATENKHLLRCIYYSEPSCLTPERDFICLLLRVTWLVQFPMVSEWNLANLQ